MTLAEIRTAVRNLVNEQSTDTGALFPADNVLLDWFINQASVQVAIDLYEFMPTTYWESAVPIAGPTYIPVEAHPLVYLQAAVLVGRQQEDQAVSGWLNEYERWLPKTRRTLALKAQVTP